jgi:hypothetical protein
MANHYVFQKYGGPTIQAFVEIDEPESAVVDSFLS